MVFFNYGFRVKRKPVVEMNEQRIHNIPMFHSVENVARLWLNWCCGFADNTKKVEIVC